MKPVHHPVIRAWPLVGALLLHLPGTAAEPGSAPSASLTPSATPIPLIVVTTPAGLPVDPPQPGRTISPRLAAILALNLPKYIPTPPASEKSSGSGTIDRPAAANPDSDILQLPRYVVRGPKPPVFRERDILTQRGLGKLAQKRYITQLDRALNLFRLPLFGASVESRALAMYAEDERLQNMADLARAARHAALVDRAAGANLQRLTAATFERPRE